MSQQSKHREHTIIIPAMAKDQIEIRHAIHVPIREEEGMEFLTPEALETIETVQAQMMLTRLVQTVRQMNGLENIYSTTLVMSDSFPIKHFEGCPALKGKPVCTCGLNR